MLVFFAIGATVIFQLSICLFCYSKQAKHA